METTEKNMEHGEHFNESIVNEVILEDMKKNRIDHMKYLPDMEQLEESDVMDQVISAMNAYDYDKYTEADVRRALVHDNRTPEDFKALLSPAALPLLEELLRYGRKHSEIVILEGILNAEWYRALFELAVALYGKNIYAYYFDIPFEETVKRHKTKPNCNDFSAEDMQRWWNEKDYTSVLYETRITADQDRESIVRDICQNIISNGK